MSASIKPPTGSAPGVSDVQGTADIQPSSATDASAVRGAAAQTTAAAGQTESASAAWLRQLEAGEVTRQQAIDGLVAQALEKHGAARLPASQRQELEHVLRAALLDDPVLSGLLGAD